MKSESQVRSINEAIGGIYNGKLKSAGSRKKTDEQAWKYLNLLHEYNKWLLGEQNVFEQLIESRCKTMDVSVDMHDVMDKVLLSLVL